MIISKTPVRISIGGGGTDLPSFYLRFGSHFISAAIVIIIAWFIMMVYELMLHDGIDKANLIWMGIEFIGVILLYVNDLGVFVWL